MMYKNEKFEEGKWVLMDGESEIEDYHQFMMKEDENEYFVVEHDLTYVDGKERFVCRTCNVYLNEYSEDKILEFLELGGYNGRQTPEIEAKCIAFQSMELAIIKEDFSYIREYEELLGIDYEELFADVS